MAWSGHHCGAPTRPQFLPHDSRFRTRPSSGIIPVAAAGSTSRSGDPQDAQGTARPTLQRRHRPGASASCSERGRATPDACLHASDSGRAGDARAPRRRGWTARRRQSGSANTAPTSCPTPSGWVSGPTSSAACKSPLVVQLLMIALRLRASSASSKSAVIVGAMIVLSVGLVLHPGPPVQPGRRIAGQARAVPRLRPAGTAQETEIRISRDRSRAISCSCRPAPSSRPTCG